MPRFGRQTRSASRVRLAPKHVGPRTRRAIGRRVGLSRTATATSTSPPGGTRPRRRPPRSACRSPRTQRAGGRARRAPAGSARASAAAVGGQRPAPQLPVDRPAVVRIDEREERQLVALVDVGNARRSQLQQRLPERDPLARAPPSARRRGANSSSASSPDAQPSRPSHSSSGSSQLVFAFASRSAFRGRLEPSGSSGHAPTSVW